jgi:hypothetical protein
MLAAAARGPIQIEPGTSKPTLRPMLMRIPKTHRRIPFRPYTTLGSIVTADVLTIAAIGCLWTIGSRSSGSVTTQEV